MTELVIVLTVQRQTVFLWDEWGKKKPKLLWLEVWFSPVKMVIWLHRAERGLYLRNQSYKWVTNGEEKLPWASRLASPLPNLCPKSLEIYRKNKHILSKNILSFWYFDDGSGEPCLTCLMGLRSGHCKCCSISFPSFTYIPSFFKWKHLNQFSTYLFYFFLFT